MIEDPEIHARAEAYAFGKLSVDEEKTLLEEASHDPELAQLIYQYQLEHRGMQMMFEERMRSSMSNWKKESESKILPLTSRRNLLTLAAAVVLLVVVGAWLVSRPSESKLERYALAEEFVPSEYSLRRDGNAGKEQDKGLEYLAQDQFREAMAYYDSCARSNPADEYVRFYYAQSLTLYALRSENKQPLSLADSLFSTLTGPNRAKRLRDLASWYQTLIALADDKPSFYPRLEAIAQDSIHSFWNEARQLEEEIDK